MNTPSHAGEKVGMLRIVDGIQTDLKGRAIRSGLGDLPGVREVEVIGSAVRIRYVPEMVSEQQFFQAVKTAGFQASGLQTAP